MSWLTWNKKPKIKVPQDTSYMLDDQGQTLPPTLPPPSFRDRARRFGGALRQGARNVGANFRDFGRAVSNRAHDAAGGLARVWNKGKDMGYRGVERLFESRPGDRLLRRREDRSRHTRDLARELMTRPEYEDEIEPYTPGRKTGSGYADYEG
jgi:hypothetical protein